MNGDGCPIHSWKFFHHFDFICLACCSDTSLQALYAILKKTQARLLPNGLRIPSIHPCHVVGVNKTICGLPECGRKSFLASKLSGPHARNNYGALVCGQGVYVGETRKDLPHTPGHQAVRHAGRR
eukprot:scaffold551313_cov37-Prasinocladus_malaysianus.AAC.1